jgi:hypothetical protein
MGIFAEIYGDVEQTSVSAKHEKPIYGQHLSDDDIAAFVDKTILARQRRLMLLHLVNCRKCRKAVSEVVLSQSVVNDPDESQR